ncbi:YozE family protein [Staphylococcus massiliensis]|uniref:YozE SAM-like domain-containing protein n=1 Tax=Staphylococcus massiliensis S46 TaxID=1229783 RepID=K9ANV6_9STAP|nr:YozE family protein [Staphylococcus massiliensis]EKU47721.1 hypothetical protein C273_06752 [Staphylococcus massiliensis S46]MCG3400482.1 sterile alpha motif-like domain-containing protein [Staphylococcus massiliensis]MCG3401486.1 sterile alpha motif-like domain-containing protein [Staphylococcus massiliensis]MCG3413283.1 sterile alpha motif-like domain-containing protein [Staphylococcus massiliensis]POA01295.1 hypothetical protein CD133_02255 [Staphylococcus massiliensis CCUG 55927]
MSFYEYMQSFDGDNTPLGELVAWINQDANFPRDATLPSDILLYCRKAYMPHHIEMMNVKRALGVYNQFTNHID